ncbi:MAG: dihydroorotate dehydrogenase electron transfer subunit [Candidatus Eremiobacteraeota bacterium]|nr:dihydroorotate dehydrogenase electron transfer subunit [Candidatus Eremiobacteraeota bacterium]
MPRSETVSAVHCTTVLDRREPANGVIVLGLHAPQLAHVTRPGHFVMVVPPSGQRAATALGIYEAHHQRISIMFVVCGSRTRELAQLHVGEQVDLFGPLGNGFDLSSNPKSVAIVAGGVGLASVLLPAKSVLSAGGHVRLYYGARTKSLLVDAEIFSAAGCQVECATDDGSQGFHGYVTELVRESPDLPELIIGCGPSPMLRALGRVAQARGVRAQLSLEETFACGVGACWGCVVPISSNSVQAPGFPRVLPSQSQREYVYARICRDGPVFWSDELRW